MSILLSSELKIKFAYFTFLFSQLQLLYSYCVSDRCKGRRAMEIAGQARNTALLQKEELVLLKEMGGKPSMPG